MSKVLVNTEILKNTIINYFGYLNNEGRNRLLDDLKLNDTQYLCQEIIDGEKVKGVKKIGVPNVNSLKGIIKKQFYFIDTDVNWNKTKGVNQSYDETVIAFKVILELCKIIYNETNNIEIISILLTQLKGNKYSILRSLALVKYQSKSPGKKLVGKQTMSSDNKNIGYVEEHVYPTKCFVNYFVDKICNKNIIDNEIDIVLRKYFIVNLNTDDDALLSKYGYKNSMPENWNPLTDDPFIRYERSGIDRRSIIPTENKKMVDLESLKEKTATLSNTRVEKTILIDLKQTYYNNDYFNISRKYNNLIGESNSSIEIFFDNTSVFGLIDRKANDYKAPRIRNIGNQYKNWILDNFKLGDILFLEIITPNSIKLYKKLDGKKG